jgi:hypothetical protein
LNHYLATLENDIEILRFQSSFTALGQLYFAQFPVDGFLAFKKQENNAKTFIHLIQYQSVFRHGHNNSCWIKNDENQQKLADATLEIKMKIELLMQHFVKHFDLNQIEWKYVEISDCEYNHKIPKYKDKDNTSKYNNKDFLFPFKNVYTYNGFLENILAKKLTGLIVVKDLEIKKETKILVLVLSFKEHNTTQNICPSIHRINLPASILVKKLSAFTKVHHSWLSVQTILYGCMKCLDLKKPLIFITPYSFSKLIIYAMLKKN